MNPEQVLFPLLNWKPLAQKLSSQLKNVKIKFMAHTLANYISTQSQDVNYYIKMHNQLSDTALGSLYNSPALAEKIITGSGRTLESLILSAYLLDKKQTQHVDIWSCFGNVWLGKTPPAQYEKLFSKTKNRYYVGSAIQEKILIDYSIGSDLNYPNCGKKTKLLSVDDLQSAILYMNESLNLINKLSFPAYQVICRIISNIIFRNDPSKDQLRSATSSVVLGRVVIINPLWKDENSMYHLCEAIIHETIHCILSCFEIKFPLFNNKYSTETNSIILLSPWTGDPLPIHAFLHACFVWYGIYQFWCHGTVSSSLKNFSEERKFFIRRGFENIAFRENIECYKNVINLEVLKILKNLNLN